MVVDLFRKAEVDQFQVPFGVDEDVLGLEVAVCDARVFVEVFEDETDFGGVELGGRFGEAAGATQIGKDFAAGAVFELFVRSTGCSRARSGDEPCNVQAYRASLGLGMWRSWWG